MCGTICFNVCRVKLSQFVRFRIFHTNTFAVAESQAEHLIPCVCFCGMPLLQMVADLQKTQKFSPAKVYTV